MDCLRKREQRWFAESASTEYADSVPYIADIQIISTRQLVFRENPQLQKNQKDWQGKSKMKVPMNLPPSCSNYSPPFLQLIDQTQLNIFLGSYNCICQYNFDLKLDLKVMCSFEVITYKVIISSSFSCPHIQSFIPAANILNILDNYSLQRCNATAANEAARHIVV